MDPTALKAAAAVGVALVAMIPIFNSVNEQQVDQVTVPDWLIPDNPPDGIKPPDNFKPPDDFEPPPDWTPPDGYEPPPDWTPPEGWQPPPGFGGCDPVIEKPHSRVTFEDPAAGGGGVFGPNEQKPEIEELTVNIGAHYFAHRVWVNMTDFVGDVTVTLHDADGKRNHTFTNITGPGMYKPSSNPFGFSSEREDPESAKENKLVYPPKSRGNWRLVIDYDSPEQAGNNGRIMVDWEIGYCRLPQGGGS